MTTLDRIRKDPRVDEISDERFGSNDDGVWVYLKPGWKSGSDPVGVVHAIHEDTPTKCLQELRDILPCNCEECLEIIAVRAGIRRKV